MNLVEQHKAQIENLCKKYSVKKLYVFGSILSDRFSKESDVDLLVDFDKVELSRYADNYYEFKFALEETLDRPVDLIEESSIRNPYLKQGIKTNRHLLYAA